MILDQLRDLIQNDIGQRGLRSDPERNLVNACPDDFRHACESIAAHRQPTLAIVTGFFIPTATPPAGETDGPLGALFFARALTPLGIRVGILTDGFCMSALEAGLDACGLRGKTPLVVLPTAAQANAMDDAEYGQVLERLAPTHLIAIERVGPNRAGRCLTMRCRDITDRISPAHRLFRAPNGITTIGIGDGGNEIGMGKIPADIIARNIPHGDLVACQTATDHLIVCGVSNWAAYALSAGIAHLRNASLDARLFDPQLEQRILEVMVQAGPLVDGVAGKPSATVDGLTWEDYAGILIKIGKVT
jgi:hypothetical protein